MEDFDTDKIDDAALALLYFTVHDGFRAWKGLDWEITDRLFEKGFIHDAKSKSVVFIDEGLERAEMLAKKLLAKSE